MRYLEQTKRSGLLRLNTTLLKVCLFLTVLLVVMGVAVGPTSSSAAQNPKNTDSGLSATSIGGRASPLTNPTVSLLPLSASLNPGDRCTLQVMVDAAVESLSCMDVYVAFDSTIVECATMLEGKLFREASFPTFFRWKHVTGDTAKAVDCVHTYRSYFIAPGELVSFVFEAKSIGNSPVCLAAARLWDIDRVELLPILGSCAEIVVEEPVSVPPGVPTGGGTLLNYPNPFNPITQLVLWIPFENGQSVEREVSINIYSISGSRVRSLFDGRLPSGRFEIPWDGRDDAGSGVSSGVYFAVAKTASRVLSRNLVLIR